ncbi:hypothetical protein HaLaN_19845 [Haematococcus lacustris]|uniref:Uncharacterized protein n=1 Tax=Haematococcus lacustris TaxID=44745 RepID=A0A699ZI35_HAELA|nr:hypothetical protein HaLaN_19845 [Haematococcus lacustris]
MGWLVQVSSAVKDRSRGKGRAVTAVMAQDQPTVFRSFHVALLHCNTTIAKLAPVLNIAHYIPVKLSSWPCITYACTAFMWLMSHPHFNGTSVSLAPASDCDDHCVIISTERSEPYNVTCHVTCSRDSNTGVARISGRCEEATPPIEPPTPLTIRDNGFSGLISAPIHTRIEASESGCAEAHAEPGISKLACAHACRDGLVLQIPPLQMEGGPCCPLCVLCEARQLVALAGWRSMWRGKQPPTALDRVYKPSARSQPKCMMSSRPAETSSLNRFHWPTELALRLPQLRLLWASGCEGRSQPASSSPCPVTAPHPRKHLHSLGQPMRPAPTISQTNYPRTHHRLSWRGPASTTRPCRHCCTYRGSPSSPGLPPTL